jgi:hypothetical protein
MLSTVAKVKAHVGILESDTSKDALLLTILKGTSKYIESLCSREFDLLERTEFYDGINGDELPLNQYPVSEISELKINGSTIDISAETAANILILDEKSGMLFRRYGFCTGRKTISVKYTAGYILPDTTESGEESTLPEDIELLAIRLAARVYERRTAEGVTSVSPASFTASFSSSIDSDMMETINRYRKIHI